VRNQDYWKGLPPGPKKALTMTQLLDKELGKTLEFNGAKVTGKQALARTLVSLAWDDGADTSTRIAVIKYIFDRLDGRPDLTQRIQTDYGPQVIIIDDIPR